MIVTFLPPTCNTLSDELRCVKVRLETASESEIVNRTTSNEILRESNHPQANVFFIVMSYEAGFK